jgi:hypothetical protein
LEISSIILGTYLEPRNSILPIKAATIAIEIDTCGIDT